MHQFVLIEKYLPSSIFWPNMIKQKRIPSLSVEQVLNKYKGFEGKLVCFFVINYGELECKKLDSFLELKKMGNCLILHVIPASEMMPSFLESQLIKLGYDVGFCECAEEAIFSSIFNEVLFGNVEELVSYKNLLNENFLFGHQSLAEKYVMTHNEMSLQGKSVEDIAPMQIYEIWKHRID